MVELPRATAFPSSETVHHRPPWWTPNSLINRAFQPKVHESSRSPPRTRVSSSDRGRAAPGERKINDERGHTQHTRLPTKVIRQPYQIVNYRINSPPAPGRKSGAAQHKPERTSSWRRMERDFPPAPNLWFSRLFTPRIESNDVRRMAGNRVVPTLFRCCCS